MTKKAAVINDLSGFGKCSLSAAIPILSVLGVQCCPLATAVLTGQSGYPCHFCTDLTEMLSQYRVAWEKNHASFDAIYTGYMTGYSQITEILNFLSVFRRTDTLLLVDPVMGDDGTVYSVYTEELLSGMKALSRQADIITPNLMEACLLSDTEFLDSSNFSCDEEYLDYAKNIAAKLSHNACRAQDIVITGIKYCAGETSAIHNLVANQEGIWFSSTPFLGHSYSGTGDLFASILCGCQLRGLSLRESVTLADRFLFHCIQDALRENIPRNDGVNFEQHLHELFVDCAI